MKLFKITYGGGYYEYGKKQSLKRALLNIFAPLFCAVMLFGAVFLFLSPFNFSGADKAYAYTNSDLSSATVINIESSTATYKFKEEGLNDLAEAAGYTDLTDMMNAATTAGTALTPKFSNMVVQLGKDNTSGGGALKWVPVYLSRSEEDKNNDGKNDAVLTLWLATDPYMSTWSDGTYGESVTKQFNGSTIFSNTYDGSFIRHNLNGMTGWTTDWGRGSNQSLANANIGTMVSDFYGSGSFAGFVTTPSKVGWQNVGYLKNDSNWSGNSTSVYYPCTWVDDNVWLPSIYEVNDSTLTANSTAIAFANNGGLWQVKTGNVCSTNNFGSWLRSGYANYYSNAYVLNADGSNFNPNVDNSYGNTYGVRPAIHINLESAVGAAEPEHVHSFGAWTVIKPATCTTKGERQRVCTAANCPLTGRIEKEEIAVDANAHNFDTVWHSDGTNHWHECTLCGSKGTAVAHTAGAAATCTTDQTCTVCGKILTVRFGHSWSPAWSSDASGHWHECTRAGCGAKDTVLSHNPDFASADCNHAKTCTDCGYVIEAQLTHVWDTIWHHDSTGHWHECTLCGAKDTAVAHTAGAAATCTTDQTCTVCGYIITPALGHSWSPTWSSDSSGHWHECTRAGCTAKNDEAVHSPDRAAADCTNAQKCTVCNYEMAAATGHNYVDNVVAPDCEHGGYTEHVCSNCGDNYQDNILPALGHSWSVPEWQWAGNYLTCKAKFTCSTCNKEQVETCSVTHSSATASCTVAGDTTHTASVTFNGTAYTDSKTENGVMLPHSWVLLSTTVPPDCENDGAGDFECSVCHKTETRPIDKLGHTEVTDPAVAATCTTGGKTEGKHCSVCNAVLVAQTDTPALGHSYTTYTPDGNATCTMDGTKTATCDNGCGTKDTIADVGSALGHDWGDWVVSKEATFTEEGESKRTCSHCGEEETKPLPRKGIAENSITLNLDATFEYGDTISPDAAAEHGQITFSWYDESGAELPDKPAAVGKYKLVATVAENMTEGYASATAEKTFEIVKRKVTLVIDPLSSEQGEDIIPFTATVTSGSIIAGETPYILTCTPDKDTVGEYPVTWSYADGFDEKYEITCADGVYIVSKKADDPNGGGEVDLPVDINVAFKLTQSSTDNSYSELSGMKRGYWAQIWYRNDDGTLGDEFTDKINSILTLKIPTEIIEGIRGGEEINRNKIAEGLRVYFVDSDGGLTRVKNALIAQRADDESWIVKFNYDGTYRAEVVFHAPDVAEEEIKEPQTGTPWWVWLLVGISGAAVVCAVIVIIVIAKKKRGNDGAPYDDSEIKAQLIRQNKKLDILAAKKSDMDKPLTDEQLRSYFSDEELKKMLSKEDYARVTRKKK